MLRRHHFVSRTTNFARKDATVVLTISTSCRTLFGKFGKSDSDNNNNNNNKTSSFADELKLQQMKRAYEMLASQSKEKQLELMKQAMALQHSLSRIPGLGKLTEKNTAMMKEMLDKISASPSSANPASSQTIMTNNTFARTGMPSVDNAMLNNINNNNNNNVKSTSLTASRGPTLDELKKVNLGSEIEALFEELRTIRNKKNEYRQKYQDVQASFDNMLREKEKLISQEVDLRTRLRKTEQEVMKLTNQNMELEELKKQVKALELAKRKSEEEVRSLQSQANESPTLGSASYVALQQQLQNKEDALRSLHRKLDRLRLRDPLLQFSLACSDIARLCENTSYSNNNSYVDVNESKSNADGFKSNSNVSKENNVNSNCNSLAERAAQSAEDAFNKLRNNFERKQREAWEESAHTDGLAAMALASVVQRFCVSNIPCANLDAIVTIHLTNTNADNTNVNTIKSKLSELFAHLDFTIDTLHDAITNSSTSLSSVKLVIKSASDASLFASLPGPFGYAMALKEISTIIINNNNNSNKANTKRYNSFNNSNTHSESDSNSFLQVKEALQTYCPWLTEFHILDVAPFVSEELIKNTHRSTIHMESARASGPGGQATNVSETQIYARLIIDGANMYTTESQDSRSALSNRELALDKLHHQKRNQFNEQLARQYKYEESVKRIVSHLHRIGGEHLSSENNMRYVLAALENNSIHAANVMLICALEEWCKSAAAAVEHNADAEYVYKN